LVESLAGGDGEAAVAAAAGAAAEPNANPLGAAGIVLLKLKLGLAEGGCTLETARVGGGETAAFEPPKLKLGLDAGANDEKSTGLVGAGGEEASPKLKVIADEGVGVARAGARGGRRLGLGAGGPKVNPPSKLQP
jgi:hypothetical protein